MAGRPIKHNGLKNCRDNLHDEMVVCLLNRTNTYMYVMKNVLSKTLYAAYDTVSTTARERQIERDNQTDKQRQPCSYHNST